MTLLSYSLRTYTTSLSGLVPRLLALCAVLTPHFLMVTVIIICLATVQTDLLAQETKPEDNLLGEIESELAKQKEETPKEPKGSFLGSLFDGFFTSKGWVFEKQVFFSGRYSDVRRKVEGVNAAGFELFRKISGPEGDIGEFDLQLLATRYDEQFMRSMKMKRPWTDDRDDWKLEYHNAYLKLRVSPPQLNVWLGHFDVPYGLEPYIDTHLQLLQMPNSVVGFKKDWGIAAGGQWEKVEYQLSLTRGSGMEIVDNRGNYLLALKVSTARTGEHTEEWLGFSVLYGDLIDPMATMRSVRMPASSFTGNVVRKLRTGIDFQRIVGSLTLRGEVSWGQDSEREDILGIFFEAGAILDKKGNLKLVVQSESFIQDFDKSNRQEYSVGRLGFIYKISANVNLQLVWSHDFDTIVGKPDDTIALGLAITAGGGLLSW